jgi:hypothetical protein
VAEWSCSGLQSRVRRFDSDLSLQSLIRCPVFRAVIYMRMVDRRLPADHVPALAACRSVGHRFQRIIECKCVGFLDRWKILECLRPLTGNRENWVDNITMAYEPFVVRVRRDVGVLVRVGAQVEKLR